MRRLYACLLFIILTSPLFANRDAADLTQFLIDTDKEASDLYDKGYYSKAAEVYSQALPFCNERKDTLCDKIWIGKMASDIFSGDLKSVEKYLNGIDAFFKDYPLLHRKLKYYQVRATYEHNVANFEKAQSTFDYAISLAKSDNYNNNLVRANLHNSRGNLFIELNQFEKAMKDYRKSLNLMLKAKGDYDEHIATSFNNVGVVHHYLGDFDSANYYYIVAKDRYIKMYGNNHPHVARQLYNIGQVYWIKGYYDEALSNYKKALEVRIATHGEKHLEVAKLYGAIGQLYQEIMDYDQALINFRKQNAIAKEIYGSKHPYLAECLNDIGAILHAKKKHNEAKEYYLAAYKLRLDNYTENHLDVARSAYNLAQFYLDINQPKEALYWAQKNFNIIKKVQGKEESLKYLNALELVADVEFKLGNRKEALAMYRQSLVLYEKNYHSGHWMLSNIYVKLAKCVAGSSPEEAEKHYEKAVLLSQNTGIEEGDFQNKIFHPNYLDVLFERARFYESICKWKEALRDVKKIVTLLPQIRKTFRFDNSKLILSENYDKVFEIGVEACWNLYQSTKNKNYLSQAFLFIEGSKQNVLFEEMYHYSNLQISGVPESIVLEEKKLKADLLFFFQETIDFGDEDKSLMQKLKNAEKKWADFTEKIKNKYPEYYNLKYKAEPPGLSGISASLRRNQTLIEYFVSEKVIFAIVVDNKESQLFKLDNTGNLEKSVIDITQKLKHISYQEYKSKAYDIYKTLFQPLENYLTTDLVIVPDDYLYGLSFESLIKSNKATNGKEAYLIWDYMIQYAASASLFLHNSGQNRKVKNLLAVLPYHKGNNQSDNSLPGTVKEISFLKKYFKISTLEGANAKRENLEKKLPDYDILHFATHAYFDDENPMNSYFQLHNDKFYTNHLYQSSLKASLTVLSACNTGSGKVSRGEGQLSLARGFSYAGCNNIVMSLWAIPDKSTAQIMQHFYKNISKKTGKAEALRQAKLNYLQSSTAHATMPLYWAGIILQGNNEEIILSPRIFKYNGKITVSIIVVSLLLINFYRRRFPERMYGTAV